MEKPHDADPRCHRTERNTPKFTPKPTPKTDLVPSPLVSRFCLVAGGHVSRFCYGALPSGRGPRSVFLPLSFFSLFFWDMLLNAEHIPKN